MICFITRLVLSCAILGVIPASVAGALFYFGATRALAMVIVGAVIIGYLLREFLGRHLKALFLDALTSPRTLLDDYLWAKRSRAIHSSLGVRVTPGR